MFHPFRLVLAMVSALFLAVPLYAQDTGATATVTIPEDLTPEQVDDLVARMSDDQVRTILLERLDAVAEKQAAEKANVDDPLTEISEIWAEMVSSWTHVLTTLPNIVTAQITAFSNFSDTFGTTGVFVLMGCQGRRKIGPLGRRKSRPVWIEPFV